MRARQGTSTRFSAGLLMGAIVIEAAAILSGCAETRVVKVNGMGTLFSEYSNEDPGASGGAGDHGGERAVPTPLRMTNPDGTVTLVCLTPDHVVGHVRQCIADGDFEMLFDQLLAQQTKDTYLARGKDPREAMKWFEENRQPILLLLARMPNGMNSPDVIWEQEGPIIRMRVYGPAARDLKLKTVDVTREGGRFRLVMIE